MRRLLSFHLLFTWLLTPVWGAEPETPLAVGSFTVIDEWIGQVSGGKIPHFALIPTGGELHGYTLSAQDARRLSRATLVVGIHPQLEPWLADWAKANQRESDVLWLYPDPLPSGNHLWIVPMEVRPMLLRLSKRMEKMGVMDTQINVDKQLKEVNAIESELSGLFAKVPTEKRAIITQHPGLEGFASAFGLQVAGSILESASAESSDPSAQHYAKLLKTIRQEKVRLITVDEGQNHAFAERLAQDAGLPKPTALCFEYLQKPGTPGDTWASMMRLNARKLAAALQQP